MYTILYYTGADYAGPINIESRYGRGAKLTKCYIPLFICFTTKAVYLEAVSEMTTDEFLATINLCS